MPTQGSELPLVDTRYTDSFDQTVRTNDGGPAYHALMEIDEAGIAMSDPNQAQRMLDQAIATDPTLIERASIMTPDEFRAEVQKLLGITPPIKRAESGVWKRVTSAVSNLWGDNGQPAV